MRTTNALFSTTALLTINALGRDVPANLRNFYDTVKPGKCSGSDLLKGGFQSGGESDAKGKHATLLLPS